MEIFQKVVNNPERRSKPRIQCQYTVLIRGRDSRGQKYREPGLLANLSASGLYFWANRPVNVGEKLFILVHMDDAFFDEQPPRLATNGVVIRAEPYPDGVFGIAVKFENYRFL